jgi:hypothetical protein
VSRPRRWRGGRVAEGGGLLNRYRGNTPIVGSNPIPSANLNRLRIPRFQAFERVPGTASVRQSRAPGKPSRRRSDALLSAETFAELADFVQLALGVRCRVPSPAPPRVEQRRAGTERSCNPKVFPSICRLTKLVFWRSRGHTFPDYRPPRLTQPRSSS